jgi:hypothetical protein
MRIDQEIAPSTLIVNSRNFIPKIVYQALSTCQRKLGIVADRG